MIGLFTYCSVYKYVTGRDACVRHLYVMKLGSIVDRSLLAVSASAFEQLVTNGSSNFEACFISTC